MDLPVIGEVTTSHLLLSLCALLAFAYYRYSRSYFGAWDGINLPGPKFEFFYGYSRQTKGTNFVEVSEDLFRRFGKNVARYDTMRRFPVLSTCDVNLLRHVLARDFNNFVDRNDTIRTRTHMKKGVFFAKGNNWKRIRSILSPTFSSGKLKLMTPYVNSAGEKLAEHLLSKTDVPTIEVKKECGQFTSQLMATLGFGIDPQAIGQETDCEFTQHTKNLVVPLPFSAWFTKILVILISTFPFLMDVFFWVGILPDTVRSDANEYFNNLLDTTMASRRGAAPRKNPDMLDLMMNAEMPDDAEVATLTDKKKLSHDEIIGQSLLLLFAGYETTATAFTMTLYNLARYPEVQERVVQEMQSTVQGSAPSYEELSQLKYLEQVINETLRLYPPLSMIHRVCRETRTYDGITVPKGVAVEIYIWKILKHEDYWENPEEFNPDRFSEENKAARDPLTFIPFGYGPRLCLGQRLAYQEVKTGLVHVLRKVKVELNENTEPKVGSEIKLMPRILITPEKPIRIAVSPR